MRSLMCFGIFFLYVNIFLTPTESSKSPWNTFSTLTGTKLGEQRDGISFVKQYLNRFGYLSSNSDVPYDDKFDKELQSAVLSFQRFFHLNQTGVIDASTVSTMMKPRCGVADLVDHTNTSSAIGHGRNLYSYFPGQPTWPAEKRSLKYSFFTTNTSIAEDILSKVFSRAFGRWQKVTKLEFTEVASTEKADIVLHFFVGDHGDMYPFDGRQGVLAHAFPPVMGELHFDGAELWTASPDDAASPDLYKYRVAMDLESVAVHEIGHTLGLEHSNVSGAVMNPYINAQTRHVDLGTDDIQGIQNLYGVK